MKHSVDRLTVFEYPMGNDVHVRVVALGTVTQKRLRKLIAYIKMGIDAYPENVTGVPEEHARAVGVPDAEIESSRSQPTREGEE